MKFLLCVSLLFLASTGSQEQSSLTVETDRIKGIICAGAKGWEFMFEAREYWTPTKAQVLDAETRIERFLKDKPPAQSPNLWQKLPRYKRQYVGIIVDGHQRIFFNFYCTEEPLSCRPVSYDDGGDCFFQLEYDVEGKKVKRLNINGEA